MGFTKNKGLSVLITIFALIIFNVIAFILPVQHTVLFWMGYSFAVFANIFMLAVTLITLSKPGLNSKFNNLPLINLAWIYFIVQTIISLLQMVGAVFSHTSGIIVNTLLSGLFIIIAILTYASISEITRVDTKIARKTFYIKSLLVDIELLKTDDEELSKQLKNLSEAIRFSDPMSHSQLSFIEDEISDKTDLLRRSINDPDKAVSFCKDIQQLLEERNKKCVILKGVPEQKQTVDNSGVKIVAVAFGTISAFAAFVLVVYFVIIPTTLYNDAVALFNAEHYEDAIVALEKLGNYKDCTLRIQMAEEKIQENKYVLAESKYNDQMFVEAVKLYDELGDYKDSKDKIEHIYNMLATDGAIYFGEYKGNPIPWKILKTEETRMLLITEHPIERLAFHDELKNITWESSSIRKWLNQDFLSEFSSEQKGRILKSAENPNDNVFIFTVEEYNKYSQNISFKTDSDWWLSTKTSHGMMYVYGANDQVNTTGESVIRAMGVRPCVWVTLK